MRSVFLNEIKSCYIKDLPLFILNIYFQIKRLTFGRWASWRSRWWTVNPPTWRRRRFELSSSSPLTAGRTSARGTTSPRSSRTFSISVCRWERKKIKTLFKSTLLMWNPNITSIDALVGWGIRRLWHRIHRPKKLID